MFNLVKAVAVEKYNSPVPFAFCAVLFYSTCIILVLSCKTALFKNVMCLYLLLEEEQFEEKYMRLFSRRMYWVDSGSTARIEVARMDDGGGRTELVNQDLTWPNGLAIDFQGMLHPVFSNSHIGHACK